ncbi:hypothetical protein J6A34_06155 [bacterium]|nr:hypothetical protein [bacterium]
MACRVLFFDYRQSEEKFFKEHNFENFDIRFFKESLDENFVEKLTQEDLEETMIISVFINSSVNENIISKFKNLRIISTRSTGYDHICLDSCAAKHIALINVESYGCTSVAQFTLAMMLMLVRNLYPTLLISEKHDSHMFENLCGRDLNKLTLGVIGTGAIGSAVCRYAHSFGMDIVACDPVQKKELIAAFDVKYLDMEEVLKQSDILTLHLPFTNENYHMISYEQLEMMKENSYLINVSRGEVVDTKALLEFAKQGKFKGIALDVVACESSQNNGIDRTSLMCFETSQAVKELSKLPNVILTPHMAYDTEEAIYYILESTFEGITDVLKGGHQYRVL